MKTLSITLSKTVSSLTAGSLFMGLVASGSVALALSVSALAIITIVKVK